MLKVENLSVSYDGIPAIMDVSFEVRAQEIVSIVGANGAGKSTVLSALSGLVKKNSGRVALDGTDISDATAHDIVDLGLIHIPEGRQLFSFMTVEENLVMGAYAHHIRPRQAQQMEFVYSLLPRLKERRHQIVSTMSGGEQQMCAIGRGLMSCPRFLMMDEPTLGLAPLLCAEVFQLAQKIRDEGIPVLIVEQQVVQSLQISGRCYVLENGTIVMSGNAGSLLEDDRLRQAYLGV
jgi:branched-chain amino acid transport system ATP-binding protein